MANKVDAKLTWEKGMAFTGHTGSGHEMRLDASAESGGADSAGRPLETLLVALGGCTGMDVVSILRKMRQEVTDYEINLHAERAREHPKVFTRVVVEHVLTGHNLSEDAVKKAIGLSENKYCSANAMLRKAVPIEFRYRIVNAPAAAVAGAALP
ncbi:MAG: OsmC family protein [Chloroflexota bacterium]